MKINIKNRINILFVSAILIFLNLGCDAWVTLSGKVSDENGKAIAGTKIIVKQGDAKVVETSSNENGEFHFNENICPMPGCSKDINVTVSKEGFQIFEKTLSEKEFKSKRLDIVLKKNP